MLQKRQIVIVHDLGDATFSCIERKFFIMLPGDIHHSDQMHHVAAYIIARETQKLVVWQDIGGLKHYVKPDSKFNNNHSLLDPRDNNVLVNMLVY